MVDYKLGEGWTILNPIEQSIKRKIETVGTPLKDWDITINYGIKTGCNDAFIIDDMKRIEILNNCMNADERERTAQLIRPILRGKDIKRNAYDFAGQYLLTTHDGYTDGDGKIVQRVNIGEYPAVKEHLDKFWDIICARTDQGKTPYNLRSCAYMDDFSKQKIVYPNMTKFMPFVYDNNGFYTNQKCFIVTGECISFLTAFFNSSLFKYCFRDNFPELQGGTRELSKVFFDKIPIRRVSHEENMMFESKILEIQELKAKGIDTHKKEIEIDNIIFDLYQLTSKERALIGFIEIQ